MRELGLRLLILLYWAFGRGPWVVVGQYQDDDGRIHRFRTGSVSNDGYWVHTFDDPDDANNYCHTRNEKANTDPLGTTYFVCHEAELNHFGIGRK